MKTIDRSKLEGLRKCGQKIIARCPACAEHGGDSKRCHLAIFPKGAFNCIAYGGDKEHNRRILELCGIDDGMSKRRGGKLNWKPLCIPPSKILKFIPFSDTTDGI